MRYAQAERIANRHGFKDEIAIIGALDLVEELLRAEADEIEREIGDGVSHSRAHLNSVRRAAEAVAALEWEQGGECEVVGLGNLVTAF